MAMGGQPQQYYVNQNLNFNLNFNFGGHQPMPPPAQQQQPAQVATQLLRSQQAAPRMQ